MAPTSSPDEVVTRDDWNNGQPVLILAVCPTPAGTAVRYQDVGARTRACQTVVPHRKHGKRGQR
jgi:hypothetical protein